MATAASITPKKDDAIYRDVEGKIIHDPIHGSMFFPEPLIKIIDTVEFQRLRCIKQLGGTYLVFPGASHTRFDHSIGTAYLCGTLMKSLKERDKNGKINDKDIMLVQIAGLCHDLGQGPFSRVYKHQYLRKLKQVDDWKQSQFAIKIFEIILEKDKVKDVFKKNNIESEDIEFIKHAMTGVVPKNPKKDRFLYEIVKNKRNGVDCNMFDTILRDCFFVGIKSNFDYARYFLNISINKVENEYRICTRYKEKFELRELFHTLWALQHRVYRHKTTVVIEMMLAEALHHAEDVFGIFEARLEPAKLLTLSDDIMNRIMYTEDERLAKSKEIIKRIQERQLYRFCGQTTPKTIIADEVNFCNEIKEAIVKKNKSSRNGKENNFSTVGKDDNKTIKEEDMVIDIVDINYGIGYGDPMDKTDFVNKYGKLVTAKNQIIPEEQSHPQQSPCESPNCSHGFNDACQDSATPGTSNTRIQTPRLLKNQYIRVYARDKRNQDAVLAGFHSWCVEKSFEVSVDMEKIPVEHEDTPFKPKAVRRLDFD